ncbi:MAG TPA: hypothetical protein VES92_12045, partial [Nitrospiraceae bacterium]|nr:hypothetical protein [Nitrospiraceae bacterium]
KPMVVFLLLGRDGVINRDGIAKQCTRRLKSLSILSHQGMGQPAERFAEGAGTHRLFSSSLLP